MISSKKRGRPKKKDLTIDISQDIKSKCVDDIKNRINELMNHEIAYEFLNNVAFKTVNIDSHTKKTALECMEMITQKYGPDVARNTQNFFTESKELTILLQKYRLKHKDECRPPPNDIAVSTEVEYMTEDGLFDDTEKDAEQIDLDTDKNTPPKGSRTAFLNIKDPITEFKQEGVMKLPQQQAAILMVHKHEIFKEGITYQEQIYKVIELIYIPGKNSICGPAAIGRLFGVNRGTIATHVKRMEQEKNESVGRPPTLDQEEKNILFIHIRDSYDAKKPTCYNALIDFIFNKFAKVISNDALWHIIHRSESFKTIKGHPMESTRAEVPLDIIEEHYKRLSSVLNEEIPPQFFFNVDESGFQDFVDARDIILIVPNECPDEELCYSVNRNMKRATMIGCIAADGTALKPFVISPNKTVEKELRTLGYRDNNVIIVSQENGFVNSPAFAYWADFVLFPEIRRRRVEYHYRGTAVVTMDGCSAHFSDYFMDECSFHGVYPFTEPAGTSDQVQPLDLGIFGIQKALKKQSSKFAHLSENSQNIIGVVDSWHKATTPSNIVSAFNQAGIYVVRDGEKEYVQASIEYARAVRGIEHKPCMNIVNGTKCCNVTIL